MDVKAIEQEVDKISLDIVRVTEKCLRKGDIEVAKELLFGILSDKHSLWKMASANVDEGVTVAKVHKPAAPRCRGCASKKKSDRLAKLFQKPQCLVFA